jgi:hypothetical protein
MIDFNETIQYFCEGTEEPTLTSHDGEDKLRCRCEELTYKVRIDLEAPCDFSLVSPRWWPVHPSDERNSSGWDRMR